MSVKIVEGNIFTTQCGTIVNTINCVGVMGAGIALECRLRYPEMYKKYIDFCEQGRIDIGLLWLFKGEERWVLNFPTKLHWRNPSKVEYLHAGLKKFTETYKERNVSSIAFPILGGDKGGIPLKISLEIMRSYLDYVEAEVEIYVYDPSSKDDLYEKTKSWVLSQNASDISLKTGLRKDYVGKLMDAMSSPEIVQLNQLAQAKGVGIKTLEKVFHLSRNLGEIECMAEEKQKKLF